MEVEKVYAFGGSKFLEYVKLKDFKLLVETELEYFDDTDNFPDYYSKFITTQSLPRIHIFRELFFEHILYGRLTNIFVHKIKTSSPSSELFLKRVDRVLDNFKSNLATTIQGFVSSKGFYLMDTIGVSVDGADFVAGFDYKEEEGLITEARFMFGRSVYRKQKDGSSIGCYIISGVDINFVENYCAILTKNPIGVKPIVSDDNETTKTQNNMNTFLKINVLDELSILTEFDYIKDQKSMFRMCQGLLGSLINDMKEEVFDLTSRGIDSSVAKLSNVLCGDGQKFPKGELDLIKKKMKFLFLGLYINNNFNEEDMRLKARELDLIGYPTKISFKNSRSNRSSTGTTTAKKSIASSDTLYSLLTDFENSNKLPKWSMSWFVDYEKKSDLDVIQTTIESTKSNFKITNVALRHLNKEVVRHVIRTINEYRVYQ